MLNYTYKPDKLDKIINLSYTKDFSNFSFEELYRIAYNFILHRKFILYNGISHYALEMPHSTESNISNIPYKNINQTSVDYLNLLYNMLDSRNCVFNNIQELLDFGANELKINGISNYKKESEWILLNIMDKNSSWLIMNRNHPLNDKDTNLFINCINQRSDHIPIQLVMGRATFYGRDFSILPDVIQVFRKF